MHISRYANCFDIDDRQSLLISSLTGAADILDEESRNAWFGLVANTGTPTDPALIATLQERGYVFPSQEAETQLFAELRDAFEKARKGEVLRLAICPTFQCNLACKYCYEGQLPQTSTKALTEEDVLHLFEVIDSNYGTRGRRVSIELTGGEPLLPRNRAAVERVFTETARRGHHIGAVSNGVCLASHFADLFIRHREHMSFVQVTLDGPPAIHNNRRPFRNGAETFQHIANSLDFLVTHRIPTRLRVNIDSSNVMHLSELAELILQKGWLMNGCLECDIAPVLDHRGTSEYTHITSEPELMHQVWDLASRDPRIQRVFRFRLFRVLQHISGIVDGGKGFPSPCVQYCEANSPNFFVFGADGFIYACGEAIGNPEFAIGRFLPNYEMWPDKERLWRGRSIASVPSCRNCSIAGLCGGGCTYSSLVHGGSPDDHACGNAMELLRSYCRTLAGPCTFSGDKVELVERAK